MPTCFGPRYQGSWCIEASVTVSWEASFSLSSLVADRRADTVDNGFVQSFAGCDHRGRASAKSSLISAMYTLFLTPCVEPKSDDVITLECTLKPSFLARQMKPLRASANFQKLATFSTPTMGTFGSRRSRSKKRSICLPESTRSPSLDPPLVYEVHGGVTWM